MEGAELQVIQSVSLPRHSLESSSTRQMDQLDAEKRINDILDANGYPLWKRAARSNFHVNHRWDEVYR